MRESKTLIHLGSFFHLINSHFRNRKPFKKAEYSRLKFILLYFNYATQNNKNTSKLIHFIF